MRKPPGVIIWRNGALATTSRNADNSAVSSGTANLRSTVAPGPSCSCRNSRSAGLSNRFQVIRSLSLRVVENDADRVTMSAPDAADAVQEIDAIRSASALHGTIMNREHNAITLAKRHNDRSRLHPRPLLRHHEFATGKVFVRL